MPTVTTNSYGHSRRDEVRGKGGMGVSVCGGGGGGWWWWGGSLSELADGSQNMKQCWGSVWWVRCTELQAGERAC